jgi:hypothetical protein
MNINDYPHSSLCEDGSLHSTGQHCLGFPRVIWDALIHFGYDGPIPLCHCHPFWAHGLNMCEVKVELPFDPMTPWTGAIVSSEIDNTVENMAHVNLTSLCERSLAATVEMLIMLFPIRDQEVPMW